jgi:purine nucleosidase
MTGRVIIDCDPGIDDALALMLACGSPEIDLIAVTTVCGNRSVETTSLNAGRILQVAGRPDVPVLVGCALPIASKVPRYNLIHGEDGLGGVALPTGREPAESHAADYITRVLLDSAPGLVTIVAIGPLTNLAFAEIKHPGLLARAESLLVMGGAAFCPGNATPNAEFNFHADPPAVQTVLSAGANVKLFGLDVTSKAVMSGAWIESFAGMKTRCARAAHAMLCAYVVRDPKLHDACPVAYILDPDLFESEFCSVSIDCEPGATEGRLCASSLSRDDPRHESRAIVFTDVDRERLLTLVQERIARLP